MVRSMMVLCGLIVSQMALTEVSAQTVRFGYSGLHGLEAETYEAMSLDARRAHLESRSALAVSLGADVLRTGGATPLLLEVPADGEVDWTALDHAVGVMSIPEIELCVTLPGVPSQLEQPAFNAFIADVLERYDGDLDFGVDPLDLNKSFPDINGSGSITNDDWDASSEAQLAWAAAHQLKTLEVGQRIRDLEESTNIGDDDYAGLLGVISSLVDSADGDMSVMLGSVWVHEDSQQRFVSRLEGLDDATRASVIASNITVYGELTSPDISNAVINVEKFDSWLSAAGLDDTSRWLGSLSVPSAVNDDAGGPCDDARCSERSQASALVRLAATAVRAGYTSLLYERPIELTGAGVSANEWTSTGLLELEVVAGIDLAILPIKPRPAYGVWRWLQSTFAGVNASDFTTLHDTPQGVEGMVLPSGWLIWFDWFAGAAPGADYAGEERPVILTGLTSSSLRVLTLWPESVCMQLGEEGECEVTWTETYVPVVDESAQVIVGQDPVWVEASDVVVAPEGETEEAPEPTEADASSEDDITVDPTDDVETPTEGPVDEGGCNSSDSSQGWLGLFALLAAWVVRRCSPLRVRTH